MITSAIIDSREPQWVRNLTFGGVPTAQTALDAGDLMATCDDNAILLVERKTPSDLLNTIRDKRLFPQCEGMCKVSPWSYLVITGLLYRDREGHVTVSGAGHTGWNFDAVQGALLTCQEMGTGVVYCGSDQDYEQTVIRLGNRNRGTVCIKPPRDAYLLKSGEAALAALPGIGVERVQTLMQHFKRPADALVWLCDSACSQVPGIGSGIKNAVRQALGLTGNEALYAMRDVYPFTLERNGESGLILADAFCAEIVEEMTKEVK